MLQRRLLLASCAWSVHCRRMASQTAQRLPALRGKINEKERDGLPAATLARLTHALWGLDHYPGYLKRWRKPLWQ